MNKIILALLLLTIALIGAGTVAAADAGNATTVDNTFHTDISIPDNTQTAVAPDSIHSQDSTPCKVSGGKQIEKSDMKVSTEKDTPAKTVKKVSTEKQIKNTPKKSAKQTQENEMAKSVASLYKSHKIDTITMATGLTHSQVVKMIKDIKAGKYGKTLQKEVLDKDKKAENKKIATKVISLYGINNAKDISAITGLKYSKVVKIIDDVRNGVYGKALQKSLAEKEILIF
jgi:Fic family protein